MDRLTIENIGGDCVFFRNFAGAPTKYNAAGGKRNFGILLDPDYARELANEGWYIRWTKPRTTDEEARPYLSVNLKYGGKKPPKVVLVTSKKKTRLDEDLVHILDLFDRDDILNIKMRLRPNEWDETGKYGASAWVEVLYVQVRDDDLEEEYADIPYDDDHEVPFA